MGGLIVCLFFTLPKMQSVMSNVNIQQYFDSLKPAGFAMGSVLVRYEIFQHEQITQMLLSSLEFNSPTS